jgi:hypothetical protein
MQLTCYRNCERTPNRKLKGSASCFVHEAPIHTHFLLNLFISMINLSYLIKSLITGVVIQI